ncbi:MAG TPA: protease pro-enzyme activation domain-containing protein [Solirubrobacteraceae bacterium]
MSTSRPSGNRLAALTCAVAGVAASVGPSATAASAAAPSPRITFYFGLKRPEQRAAAAFFAVQRPGSPTYRRFLSLAQIAGRYGAGPGTRRAFVRDIGRLRLRARIDPSGVFARVTGTVARFDAAFRVRITQEFFNSPNAEAYFLPPKGKLHLPRDLRPLVQDVVANFNHSQAAPPGQSTARRAAADKPRNRGTWIQGCRAARALHTYSYAQVRHAYGIGALGGGGGSRVAILNVGEDSPGTDIADNARCFGYPRLSARTLRTDGQTAPFGRGTFEPDEDLALVRGMAPRLRSLTFSKAWLNPPLWFLGAAQVLTARPLPDTFSISYGECERAIRGRVADPTTRASANLMDSILLRLGLGGVGTFASAGDFGSTCDGEPFAGVTWPASSPYVTAVSGSRLVLNRVNQRVNEVVWNDLRWMSAVQGGGAAGGGFSAVSAKPPYQAAIAGDHRAEPDISANASNFPGWPVVLAGQWEVDGGTSASAPLMASAFAIADSDLRARHRPPLGPVNGLLYDLRASAPQTFYDIVSGSNGYSRRVPARRAHPGYDLASGLGVPRFGRLLGSLLPPG